MQIAATMVGSSKGIIRIARNGDGQIGALAS